MYGENNSVTVLTVLTVLTVTVEENEMHVSCPNTFLQTVLGILR